MNSTLLIIHSLLRWIILLTGIWAFIRALQGMNGKPLLPLTIKPACSFLLAWISSSW